MIAFHIPSISAAIITYDYTAQHPSLGYTAIGTFGYNTDAVDQLSGDIDGRYLTGFFTGYGNEFDPFNYKSNGTTNTEDIFVQIKYDSSTPIYTLLMILPR